MEVLQQFVDNEPDFDPACAAYNRCPDAKLDPQSCLLSMAAPLLAACDDDSDTRCPNVALFTALVIWYRYQIIERSPRAASADYEGNENLLEAYARAMARDYDGALAYLPRLGGNDLGEAIDRPYDLYARGLALEIMGRYEEALETYDVLMESGYEWFVLPHFSRGMLYGASGEYARASFEAAWLTRFLDTYAPTLLSVVAPFAQSYPLDTSRLTDWLYYPVWRHAESPIGSIYVDNTAAPPIPVQIAFYPELDGLLAIGLRNRPPIFDEILPGNVYLLLETDDGFAQYFYLVESFESLSLTRREDGFWGEEVGSGVEGYSTDSFILVPRDAPDPRIALGERVCVGGVMSRLQPGMSVRESSAGMAHLVGLGRQEMSRPTRFGWTILFLCPTNSSALVRNFGGLC
ncbi:MAG: tetratricopeptide repeat protein [Chloroflexi bacterium]|nr:tetratricopeptide repeat protein [Chloroflexota bacterium]